MPKVLAVPIVVEYVGIYRLMVHCSSHYNIWIAKLLKNFGNADSFVNVRDFKIFFTIVKWLNNWLLLLVNAGI